MNIQIHCYCYHIKHQLPFKSVKKKKRNILFNLKKYIFFYTSYGRALLIRNSLFLLPKKTFNYLSFLKDTFLGFSFSFFPLSTLDRFYWNFFLLAWFLMSISSKLYPYSSAGNVPNTTPFPLGLASLEI